MDRPAFVRGEHATMENMRKQPIRWQGWEYEHRERSSDWFFALGIVGITAAITAIILENILLAILILIATGVVALFARRPPNTAHFEISERGIAVDRSLHPFHTLDSFWVEDRYEGAPPKLFLKSRRVLMPFIIIPLHEEIHPDDVRDFLLEHLDEEEHQEPFVERLMNVVGF